MVAPIGNLLVGRETCGRCVGRLDLGVDIDLKSGQFSYAGVLPGVEAIGPVSVGSVSHGVK